MSIRKKVLIRFADRREAVAFNFHPQNFFLEVELDTTDCLESVRQRVASVATDKAWREKNMGTFVTESIIGLSFNIGFPNDRIRITGRSTAAGEIDKAFGCDEVVYVWFKDTTESIKDGLDAQFARWDWLQSNNIPWISCFNGQHGQRCTVVSSAVKLSSVTYL
jgi:hypothetical protein